MTRPGLDLLSRRGALATMSATLAAAGCAPLPASRGLRNTQIELTIATDAGDISFALEMARAPKVCGWFLDLVKTGQFNASRFWRAGHLAGHGPDPQFIEGGLLDRFLLGEAGPQPRSIVESGLPFLREWETTSQSGLTHKRGYVGLGRDIVAGGEVIPEIVIGLVDTPQMDEGGGGSPGNTGFPILGFVNRGMDVVERIAAGKRDGAAIYPFLSGQILTQPVRIERIRYAGQKRKTA